jgi:hypothetical protein
MQLVGVRHAGFQVLEIPRHDARVLQADEQPHQFTVHRRFARGKLFGDHRTERQQLIGGDFAPVNRNLRDAQQVDEVAVADERPHVLLHVLNDFDRMFLARVSNHQSQATLH